MYTDYPHVNPGHLTCGARYSEQPRNMTNMRLRICSACGCERSFKEEYFLTLSYSMFNQIVLNHIVKGRPAFIKSNVTHCTMII